MGDVQRLITVLRSTRQLDNFALIVLTCAYVKPSNREEKPMKVSLKARVDVINAYTVDLEPIMLIAARYDVTRQAIWKILKAEGVKTSGNGRITVSCSACDTEMVRWRYHVRKRINLFCSDACYFAFLEAGNGSGPYVQNRHGQRIARIKVAELFNLQAGNIVHHEDRNTLNNMVSNLRVFRNQGDHVRYHRGAEIEPIWTGED